MKRILPRVRRGALALALLVGVAAPAAAQTTWNGGDVWFRFVFSDARYADLMLVAGTTDQSVFNNHMATPGDEVSITEAQLLSMGYGFGDDLIFKLNVCTEGGMILCASGADFTWLSTDPQHAMFSGAVGTPNPTANALYNHSIGWEDKPPEISDFDYNDIIVDYSLQQTVPEPTTWALMLTGLFGLVAFGWYRRKNVAGSGILA